MDHALPQVILRQWQMPLSEDDLRQGILRQWQMPSLLSWVELYTPKILMLVLKPLGPQNVKLCGSRVTGDVRTMSCCIQ